MSDTRPTDAFGDQMVFVESYGDYLPKSENIPTCRTVNGASGVTHDGEIYCPDCAVDMGLVTRDEIHKGTRDKPRTGIVRPSHKTDTQMHCGAHAECLNAIDGEYHPYNHDVPIGVGIEQIVIQH